MKKKTVIKWKDSITIENIVDKKEELVKAFNNSSSIYIELDSLKKIDTTGVQLIMSCQKEATKTKKDFQLKGVICKDILKYAKEIGVPVGDLSTGEAVTSDILQKISGD